MPTSVHKLLFYVASVINNAILPIGELPEEAEEAKNKDVKNFLHILPEKHQGSIQMKTCFVD